MSSEVVRLRNARGKGGRLRAEIQQAAGDLLDETGDARAVTLRAVARRVGIAAPSIYRHFAEPEAIVLAVVQDAFAALTAELRAARAEAGPDPVERLLAVGASYLNFAAARPQRYRVMFGGVWNAGAAVAAAKVTEAEVTLLGQEALEILTRCIGDCAAAGQSDSTDTAGDAVAVWVGLHGLAHQRALATAFSWPHDIAERVINRLARLTARRGDGRIRGQPGTPPSSGAGPAT